MASSLECVYWERRTEGQYNRKLVYSRRMVCQITLDKPVGHFTNKITVMVVHMHNVLANGM